MALGNSIEKINFERNLQNRVYEIIKNYVMRLDTPPGARLYEEVFSKEIGVSRTPVRMALKQLEMEGLIKIIPNKGAFKVHLSWEEVREIIKVREVLEVLSLEIIKDSGKELQIEDLMKWIPDTNSLSNHGEMAKYPQFDQKFHETLIQMGKGQLIFRITKNLDNLFHLLRLIILQDVERIESSIEEHKKIIEALKTNNIQLAIEYIRENYRFALKYMEQKHKVIPELFL